MTVYQHLGFPAIKLVKQGNLYRKDCQFYIKSYQRRENVFELGADIFTFSNLMLTSSLFISKIAKKWLNYGKFHKNGADQSVRL